MWEIHIVQILHKENVKQHASFPCCFVLCHRKFFLLWYTLLHFSHLYLFTPLQPFMWYLWFLWKLNIMAPLSQCHSWKHVTRDEHDDNKNVYKIILISRIIIIIIMIIMIIRISKLAYKQLCQKHVYTKYVSNFFWYISWLFQNNV